MPYLDPEGARKHHRTFRGRIVHIHVGMRQRANKRGFELIDRNEFIRFALESREYAELYRNWVAAGYPMRLCPTVDRIDNDRGYSRDNIQFLTQSANSKKYHVTADRSYMNKPVVMIDLTTQEGRHFENRRAAATYIGAHYSSVDMAANLGRPVKNRWMFFDYAEIKKDLDSRR